jgi:hypothetical protein
MKIFLIFPFQSDQQDVYNIVKSSVSASGHWLKRSDDFSDAPDINEEIRAEITISDIIIADISNYKLSKGHGSNVRIEFLLAQSLGKPLIPICDRTEDLSIDISHYQAIIYDRLRLKETLAKPLSNYLDRSKSIDFLLRKTTDDKSLINIKSIFISYSHTDLKYLDRLKIHLKPFEKKGQIDLWADTKIYAGEKWKNMIMSALDKSVVAILLISADFLASDFIVDNELPPLLKDAEEKGKIILPVIVKPCRFTSDDNLSKYQAINNPDNPISSLNENDQEIIYVKIANFIGNLVK